MLCLGAKGSRSIPIDALATIEIPDRENVTSVWKGVKHADLRDEIVSVAQRDYGFTVSQERWGVASKGDGDLYGVVQFLNGDHLDITVPTGMGLALGVRHSNLSHFAIKMAVGAQVFVCANGCMSGDFIVSRKHTSGMNLHHVIEVAMSTFIDKARDLDAMVRALQDRRVDDRDAAYFILEAVRRKLIAPRFADMVYGLWKTPPHEEFTPRDAWSLYNAFTEAVKIMPPRVQYGVLRDMPKALMAA